MYYEINISLNGVHFFATSNRSITTEDKLKVVYNKLKNAFDEKDGYEFTIREYQTIGTEIDINKI